MKRATQEERDYFARIGRDTRAFAASDLQPCRSLQDVLDRLAEMQRRHGRFATPGIDNPDARGDLDGHLAFLAHVRAVMKRHGDTSD